MVCNGAGNWDDKRADVLYIMPEEPLSAAAAAKAIFCKCKLIETLNENEVSGEANIRVSEHYAKTKQLDSDGTR